MVKTAAAEGVPGSRCVAVAHMPPVQVALAVGEADSRAERVHDRPRVRVPDRVAGRASDTDADGAAERVAAAPGVAEGARVAVPDNVRLHVKRSLPSKVRLAVAEAVGDAERELRLRVAVPLRDGVGPAVAVGV